MDYEKKMADLDAKIKAAKQQKKVLKKKHEVDDLKLKVKSQSEQIAQLTADNRELKADNAELKAKLAETDMQTVPFPADKKFEELKHTYTALNVKHMRLNNKYKNAMLVIRDLGDQYGFDAGDLIDQLCKPYGKWEPEYKKEK